jgi:hypothetical protein
VKTFRRTLTGLTQQQPSESSLDEKTEPPIEPGPAEELSSLMSPFQDMAELNRHLIHAQETISAAVNTMQLMSEDHNKHCPLGKKDDCVNYMTRSNFKPKYPLRQVSRSLTCHTSLLSNLKFRADAFERRLNNEISHVSTANARVGDRC